MKLTRTSFSLSFFPFLFPKNSILVSRNILPKPTSLGSLEAINLASILNGPSSQHQGILNNYLSTSGLQQLGEMLNGHGSYHNGNHQPLMVGRQGVIKDVKTIIADYRQQHPESVPRRGRRVKQSSQNSNAQYDLLKNDTVNIFFLCFFNENIFNLIHISELTTFKQ